MKDGLLVRTIKLEHRAPAVHAGQISGNAVRGRPLNPGSLHRDRIHLRPRERVKHGEGIFHACPVTIRMPTTKAANANLVNVCGCVEIGLRPCAEFAMIDLPA